MWEERLLNVYRNLHFNIFFAFNCINFKEKTYLCALRGIIGAKKHTKDFDKRKATSSQELKTVKRSSFAVLRFQFFVFRSKDTLYIILNNKPKQIIYEEDYFFSYNHDVVLY